MRPEEVSAAGPRRLRNRVRRADVASRRRSPSRYRCDPRPGGTGGGEVRVSESPAPRPVSQHLEGALRRVCCRVRSPRDALVSRSRTRTRQAPHFLPNSSATVGRGRGGRAGRGSGAAGKRGRAGKSAEAGKRGSGEAGKSSYPRTIDVLGAGRLGSGQSPVTRVSSGSRHPARKWWDH